MKKILIIGASVYQLPAIIKAKEMGLYVGVADFNPNAIGISYADEYFNASTMDEDAICAVAKKFSPDGIMTLATDMPMRSVAKACEMLGLPSISYDTAIKATDKYEMIKAFKEHQIASPWYYVVNSKEELQQLYDEITYPCIMKPTDNAGSLGVILVYSQEELEDAYNYSYKQSRHGMVIIEEYLEGQEVSVEVMVVNGESYILQITDKLTTGAPHFVEMGHSQPSQLPINIQEQIRALAVNAIKAIGINCGPAHVEMMITKKNPIMIELGARMGGDNITTYLVPLSTGIDMVKATIQMALGEEPNIEPILNCGSAIRYFNPPKGKIVSIDGVEEAEKMKGIKKIILLKDIGEYSTSIQWSNDRVGCVIAQGKDAINAIYNCQAAINQVKFDIK